MCIFLAQDVEDIVYDSSSYGNYNEIKYTIAWNYATSTVSQYKNGVLAKTQNKCIYLPTGKFGKVIKEGRPKNLYDVAGNFNEWNTETLKDHASDVKNRIYLSRS